jgi:hypothetical protein
MVVPERIIEAEDRCKGALKYEFTHSKAEEMLFLGLDTFLSSFWKSANRVHNILLSHSKEE